MRILFLLPLIFLVSCSTSVNGVHSPFGSDVLEMNLTSNQENTDFYGKSLNGLNIKGNYALSVPPKNGATHLGRGKFINIDINNNGVYEIIAKAPGYIEKNVTIAPPISSRMSFVFEISEKTSDESLPAPDFVQAASGRSEDAAPSIQPVNVNKEQVLSLPAVASTNSNQTRSALVIGNSAYKFAPVLKNPANDASDISAALKKLGFTVTTLINASQQEMDEAIGNMGRRLTGGGVGLFFYAGHGTQVSGENYLLPVDANLKSEADVRYKAVNAGQILTEMGEARNGMNIIILDACRDNPFPRSYRSSKSGLAEMEAPKGSIIAFATSPGSTASDGTGRNGMYTQHILKNIETPDLPIESLFKKVLQGVNASTNGSQVPWTSSSFTGDFYFKKP